MAFGADELRVLRRALAIALHPVSLADEDVQDCLRLADSVDEAVREAGRLRAFLLADLARYRDALPGTAAGYLELLQDALAAGYDPRPEDLAALRTLRGTPSAAAVLRRCQALAELSVRARLAGRPVSTPDTVEAPPVLTAPAVCVPAPVVSVCPAPRTRLHALPGGRAADEPKPRPQPGPPAPGERPVPKPSEAFPPRRKPVPPPEQRAAG
ncbi:hypothetical protein OG883_00810 [Streptomyces sp. NBC_01142]|uniref:hypothetical protein n=1 Tax=Streptomyces sp. NBC_01142 TaxID=2975865 RepID=UPI00225A4A43|nr:hypothetical protein [Streptomyces sp. NBC_01142]MCX4818471.1 hypothetical protein [Streptomyces sp. NBC_01142]